MARGAPTAPAAGAVGAGLRGGGGGRPNLAQAGGRDGAALDGALVQGREELRMSLLEG